MTGSLKAKLIPIILVPLIIQLVTVFYINDIEGQAAQNMLGATKAKLILTKLSDVKTDLHDMILIKEEASQDPKEKASETLDRWFKHINGDFDGLLGACDQQPDMRFEITKMQQEVNKYTNVAGKIDDSFFKSVDSRDDGKASSWKNMRHFANDFVDADFVVFETRMQKIIDGTSQVQATLRERKSQYLNISTALIVIWTFCSILFVVTQSKSPD